MTRVTICRCPTSWPIIFSLPVTLQEREYTATAGVSVFDNVFTNFFYHRMTPYFYRYSYLRWRLFLRRLLHRDGQISVRTRRLSSAVCRRWEIACMNDNCRLSYRFYSQGNDGGNYQTIVSPSLSKNAISVGCSENPRQERSGNVDYIVSAVCLW